MKKKPSSKTKKKAKGKSNVAKTTERMTWVDRVMNDWVDAVATDEGPPSIEAPSTPSSPLSISLKDRLSIGIVCWNVLADSYCNKRSHRSLPVVYQNRVFDKKQRRHHVRQILKRFTTESLAPDLLALQEVDEPLQIKTVLTEAGYDGHHTPTDLSGSNGRVDSCALYYRKQVWTSIKVEYLPLDDIATLCSKHPSGLHVDASTRASLIGIETSFLRRNMAMLVKLQHVETHQEIVVAVAHLFWNPLYQEVKLCQAHYISIKAKEFSDGAPIIFAGDTNSQPKGPVHEYFTSGTVNAKVVAPWYNPNPFRFVGRSDYMPVEETMDSLAKVSLEGQSSTENSNDISPRTPRVRYLLDYTLNRLCRWLRILGIDAGLESEAEERMRTQEGKLRIFERCREEQRTLVTSSAKLVRRKDCPPGTYRLDTKALSNLELSLVHLLLSHGVQLEPTKVLSTCVVCNGRIDQVHNQATIRRIFATYKAPETLIDEDLKVWQCSGCEQGYWYDERPSSSASRVKNQAAKLLTICIRGGVSIAEDKGMFEFIDVEKTRNEPIQDDAIDDASLCALSKQLPDILEWLQKDKLESPLGPLLSAYRSSTEGEELLNFTNVTYDFVGHLDYIFHDTSFQVDRRLYVPTTFEELQDNTDVRNGHLLPSNVWPSDHLAIGVVLSLPINTSGDKNMSNQAERVHQKDPLNDAISFCMPLSAGSSVAQPPPPAIMSMVNTMQNPMQAQQQQQHGERCACGCVPNVMSLFEMAQARKKAREARKAQSTTT